MIIEPTGYNVSRNNPLYELTLLVDEDVDVSDELLVDSVYDE